MLGCRRSSGHARPGARPRYPGSPTGRPRRMATVRFARSATRHGRVIRGPSARQTADRRAGVATAPRRCRFCPPCRRRVRDREDLGNVRFMPFALRIIVDDVGQDAWHCTVRLVYGVCMVLSFRFGGGMGSRSRRAHSRLGGAAVVTDSGEVARTIRTAADHAALNGHKRCPRPAPEPAARTGKHGRTSGLRLRIGRSHTGSPADSKVL
jgi:hypothetical protein